MAKQTIVIESNNLERFFLAVQDGTLQIGDRSAHPEGTVEGLRVTRIRCELDVDEDRDAVPIAQAGVIASQVLRPGTDVHLTHANLCLHAPAGSAPVVAPAVPQAPVDAGAAAPTLAGPKRLKVTDGGDQGRSFALPEAG